MPVPVVASVGGVAANTAIPVPSGVVAGSLVVVAVITPLGSGNTADATDWTRPTGFEIAGWRSHGTPWGDNFGVAFFYKYATGADSGTYSFPNPSGTNPDGAGMAMRITGGPTSGNPFVDPFRSTGGSINDATISSFTPGGNDSLFLATIYQQTADAVTPPASFTQLGVTTTQFGGRGRWWSGSQATQAATGNLVWNTTPDPGDFHVALLGTIRGVGPADTEAPTTPTGLAKTSDTGDRLTFGWNLSSDNTAVTAYDVEVDGVILADTSTATTRTITTTPNSSYPVRVRARDAAGNTSGWTSIVTMTTGNLVTTWGSAVNAGGALRIMGVGDSLLEGTGAGSYAGRWIDKLTELVRSRHGRAGKGVSRPSQYTSGTGLPNSYSSSSGIESFVNTEGIGGHRTLWTGIGDYVEWAVPAGTTHVEVVYSVYKGNSATFHLMDLNVIVDGTTVATIDEGKGYALNAIEWGMRQRFAVNPATSHTLRLAHAGPDGGINTCVEAVVFHTADPTASSVTFYDAGHHGWKSYEFDPTRGLGMGDGRGIITGAKNLLPHLIIDEQVGTNDKDSEPTSYTTDHITKRIQFYRTVPTNPTILFVIPFGPHPDEPTPALLNGVWDASKSTAQAEGVHVLDLRTVYPNPDLSWWAADKVHSSATGQTKWAEAIDSYLASIVGTATTVLTMQNASHAHTASSPTVTAHAVVAPASATHAHTTTSPSLSQRFTVAPASATHAHTAASPSLTVHAVVAPDAASHAHTASSPSLTAHAVTSPASAAHAHTASSPSLTAHAVVAPEPSVHGHTAASPGLVAHAVTAPESAAHAHSVSSPSLVQRHVVAPAAAMHDQDATSPSLSATSPAGTMNPDPSVHEHVASSPTLAQRSSVAVDNASHGQTATSPSLMLRFTAAPDSATIAHAATSPTVTPGSSLVPASGVHAHTATSPTLSQRHSLTPDAATHGQVATSPSLALRFAVSGSPSTHAHAATSPTVTPGVGLTPQSSVHAHVATSPSLSQKYSRTPASALHGHVATSPLLVDPTIPPIPASLRATLRTPDLRATIRTQRRLEV